MRVVSCTCSNTEIVAALGCADLLVGVDDHSDWPIDVVAGLPRVGPDLGIDVARVEALEPDLILASLTVPGHEKVVAALEETKLRVMAPAPRSIDDVYRDIREIGEALGVADRAHEVVRDMQERLAPVEVESGVRRPHLLIQWWPKPVIAPGQRSWAHDLLERVGACNPLGHEAVESRPLTDEEVYALDPDAFIVSWCGVEPEKLRPDVVLGNPAWSDLRAIQDGAVYVVPEAYLGRPSPRLVDGFTRLRAVTEEVAPKR